MSPRHSRALFILAVACAVGTCTPDDSGRNSCQTDSHCNPPRVCREQICVPPSQGSVWPGFVEIGGALGDQCTAALAADPTAAVGPLTFIPCTSGQACEELAWDGAVTGNTTGSASLLEFEVQFARDAAGQAQRLLVRRHYPIGPASDPNPYEAVLYDLASGAPLAVLRNKGNRPAPVSGSSGTISGGIGVACFAIPVATLQGLWLAGAPSRSGAVVAGFLQVPGSTSVALMPAGADATFLFNAAVPLDDRLALSQDDGNIVVVSSDGSSQSTFGPGQRVWLQGTVGDRFLTANTVGPVYFTLDSALQFAPYGESQTLVTDGAHVVYVKPTATGFEAVEVSAADGISQPRVLLTLDDPSKQPDAPFGSPALRVFGTAIGDQTLVVLTNEVDLLMIDTGPITAHIVNLATAAVETKVVLANSKPSGGLAGELRLARLRGGRALAWRAELRWRRGQKGVAGPAVRHERHEHSSVPETRRGPPVSGTPAATESDHSTFTRSGPNVTTMPGPDGVW